MTEKEWRREVWPNLVVVTSVDCDYRTGKGQSFSIEVGAPLERPAWNKREEQE